MEKVEDTPLFILKQRKQEPAIKQIIAKEGIIYSAHTDNIIRLWDVKEQKCIQEIPLEEKFSLMELRIGFLYIVTDKTVLTWDTESKKFLKNQTFRGHTDWITRYIISGGVIYTASNDTTIRAWNIKTGTCLSVYEGHTDSVTCLDLSGTTLITGSADKTLKSWKGIKADDILAIGNHGKEKSRRCEQDFVGHTKLVFNVKILNGVIYSASVDGTIKAWEVRSGKCMQTYDIESVVNSFRVDFRITDDDNIYLLSSEKYTITPFNLKNGKFGTTFHGHRAEIKALKVKRGYLFSGSADREVRKWSLKDGSCSLVMKGHSQPVTSIGILADNLISGSEDGCIRAYKVLDGAEKKNLELEIQRLKEMGIDQQFSGPAIRPPSPLLSPSKDESRKGLLKDRKDSLRRILSKDSVIKKKERNSLEMDSNHKIKGSMSYSSSDSSSHEYVGWYVGPMSRDKAEDILKTYGFNCFLVRNSSIPGSYALTKWLAATKEFQHLLINSEGGRYYIKDSFDDKTYGSLNELVEKSPEIGGFAPAFDLSDDEEEDNSFFRVSLNVRGDSLNRVNKSV